MGGAWRVSRGTRPPSCWRGEDRRSGNDTTSFRARDARGATMNLNLHPDDFAAVVVTTIRKSLDGPLVKDRFESLEARIVALEAEIAALKQRPDVHDAGVFKEGTGYPKNALVTSRGYWICLTPTTTVPGSSRDWRLVVKEHKAK